MGPTFGLSALDCLPPQVRGQLEALSALDCPRPQVRGQLEALAHHREQLVQIEERQRQLLKGPPSLSSAKTSL
jgi:hypothetical protein